MVLVSILAQQEAMSLPVVLGAEVRFAALITARAGGGKRRSRVGGWRVGTVVWARIEASAESFH